MDGDPTLAGSDSSPKPEAGEHAPAPAPAQETPAPSFGDDATLAGPAGGPKPRTPPQFPEKVGRYIVTEVLGRGGMGIVYKAYDPELDRKVAVKLLLPGRGVDDEERLAREARAMAKLSHPNVVPVHDVGQHGDQLFIAMEYVDGRTLGTWLKEAERSWREIVSMFVAAAEGLCAAHEAGVTHRDFKPDNVLVDRKGRPQVTDFGLALGREEAELLGFPRKDGHRGYAACAAFRLA